MLTLLWIAVVLVGLLVLAYVNASGTVFTAAIGAALAVAWLAHTIPGWAALALTLAFVVLAIPGNLPVLRRKLVSDAVLSAFRKLLPPMSQTERDAIEAGTVWWDGELFSGRPDWQRLLATPTPALTAEEQRFLDHDVEELCAMVTDWETTHVYRDLPPRAWQFIKDRGFLGMSIAKEYGGLGFSAYAHSQVMTKLSTHSGTVSVTVMVPNSLGPGELLAHYGTEEQKRHYLPRLAKGLEIPCFALTAPAAGSDAASIPDHGIVCWGEHEGERVLGLSVTWDKRYITLGPVATLLGLAFRAFDPDHLVGEREDIGITCALIPTSHPGVVIGRRHMPLNAVFQNGPNSGKDVFIPMDWIIGGQPMLGRGWRMLMECLAAGRGISLPSSATGMAKLAVRAVGGYARVRQQFKVPIGKFEGVEEALTRMGGNLYMMDATRTLTAAAIDLKQKPAVISGITKLHLTERGRQVVIDGMDVLGGKGICMGPSNFLGAAYMQIPVAITVEGANILTRSLIVFGQGAIRCHPYVLKEIAATREPDARKASLEFDAALFGHLRFALSNLARTFVMGFTGSHFVGVRADVAPETRRYYQQLTRFSAALAFLADVSMGTLGGALKRKEKLSARLGDILSLMYLSSATLKRYGSRRPATGRCAADALGDVGRDVQGAERVRRRDLELPEPDRRGGDAPRGVPARPALRDSVRRARSRRRAALDRALRHPRSPDRGRLYLARGRRSAGRDRAGARGGDRRGADRREAARGGQGRPGRRGPAAWRGCRVARRARGRGRRDHRGRGGRARHRARAHRESDPRRRLCAGPWGIGNAARADCPASDGSVDREAQGRGVIRQPRSILRSEMI
jgi:acyl-CoA dehydrogenase